jgi:Ca-activated chloride channel family protein
MSMFGYQFEVPWVLVLLAALPLFWQLERHWHKGRPAIRVPWLKELKAPLSWRMVLFKSGRWFRYIALATMIIGLARPVLPFQEEEIKARSLSIALAIDLSSSMLAMDFEPNRLEAAKEVARSFIAERPYDLFTIVAFSAESYTVVPLTHDKRLLTDQISRLECGMLEDGTAIGMGLATAVNRIRQGKTKEKVIILLTDGVNNAGYIQPGTAAKMAEDLGLKVYTIGIGSLGEALSPVARRADGQYIFGYTRVEIDEELLQQIAARTGGKYYRATDLATLKAIYDEIDELEKTEIEISTTLSYKEEYARFLFLALIAIFLDLLFRTFFIKRVF